MDKIAPAAYPIAELIAKRWSPRAFLDKAIEEEKIMSLFEAARWAPSAYNEQPWRFLTATKEDSYLYTKMLSCLVEANQVWAKAAPLLLILVVKKDFDFNGKPNRWAMHDCGLALENLLLEAAELGLAAHPMAGFSVDLVRSGYSVPDDYEPLVAVAVGYPGTSAMLEGVLREREEDPRERKALSDLVFSETWGRSI